MKCNYFFFVLLVRYIFHATCIFGVMTAFVVHSHPMLNLPEVPTSEILAINISIQGAPKALQQIVYMRNIANPLYFFL